MNFIFILILAVCTLTFDPYSFDLDCPVDNCASITQGYHEQHHAIDIGGYVGASVYAAGDGIIYFAGKHCGTNPCANAITILHGDGTLATNYWHLDKVLVKKGDLVRQGDKIGTIGLTGITSGPHLHLSVQVNRVFVNPTIFID